MDDDLGDNDSNWDALMQSLPVNVDEGNTDGNDHAEPEPAQMAQPDMSNSGTHRGRGRQRYDYGSSFLRQLFKSSQVEAEEATAPGTIEFARAQRAMQIAERKQVEELDSQTDASNKQQLKTLQSLDEFGTAVALSNACGKTGKIHVDILNGLAQCHRKNITASDSLVEHQLEDAMSTVSAAAVEKQLGETKVLSRVQSIASACLELCYLCTVLFLTLESFWKQADLGIQPLLCVLKLRYDETPTKVRVDDPKDSDLDLNQASMEALTRANPLGSDANCLHAKIMQVELNFGVLMKHQGTNQYTWVRVELPTCLQAVESTTGLNTLQCLDTVVSSIPNLKHFVQSNTFQFRLRHSCTDRYAANTAAERGLSASYDNMELLHTFCDVHRLYSVTKASMCSHEDDVSGMLALGLGYAESGCVSFFQQVLSKIFSRDLVIHYQSPPPADSAAAMYRRDLLSLFLPVVGVSAAKKKLNKKRRYVIQYLLNGDLSNEREIQHFCTWSCCLHLWFIYSFLLTKRPSNQSSNISGS